MKRFGLIFFLLLLGTWKLIAQAAPDTLLEDGPYLFYKDGKAIVKSISSGKVITYGADLIAVKFQEHPSWNFEVKLKPELVNEPSAYPAADKLLVLSDIEGEFAAFRSLLIANKVMDEHYNWLFGNGQLVIDGDLFDRGNEVPQYLWLLYKLDKEARKKGGYVHTLLGNHDIMNLSGDLRYLEAKYLKSAKVLGVPYMDFYTAQTELGRWLRTKNVIEKIGDKLFMHAGMSPKINALQLSIDDLNRKCRAYYGIDRHKLPEDLGVFFGADAPFWYRGYFMAPKATMATVDSTLHLYDCKQIIVGHTIIDKNVTMYYQGKVIGVDVDEHAGHRGAALFERDVWYKTDDKGKHERLIYKPENDQISKNEIQ
jgi:hypothetical protein